MAEDAGNMGVGEFQPQHQQRPMPQANNVNVSKLRQALSSAFVRRQDHTLTLFQKESHDDGVGRSTIAIRLYNRRKPLKSPKRRRHERPTKLPPVHKIRRETSHIARQKCYKMRRKTFVRQPTKLKFARTPMRCTQAVVPLLISVKTKRFRGT